MYIRPLVIASIKMDQLKTMPKVTYNICFNSNCILGYFLAEQSILCIMYLYVWTCNFEFCFSDTHDKLKCNRCVNNIEVKPPPPDSNCNDSMSKWYHASSIKGVMDLELKKVWDMGVSFVFHHKSHEQINIV